MNGTSKHTRPVADWIGCCFELLFAVYLISSVDRLTILLVPLVAHQLVMSAGFLLRRSAKAKLVSWPSRFAAYGTYLTVPLFIAIARVWIPQAVSITTNPVLLNLGGFLWLGGCIFGLFGVWELRYCFSIEPQARALVTNGPYRFARHPIYASYLAQYLGIFFTRPTVPFAIVLLTWLAMMVARLHYEEVILRQVFPEYSQYANRVGMFAPRLNSLSRRSTQVLDAAGSGS